MGSGKGAQGHLPAGLGVQGVWDWMSSPAGPRAGLVGLISVGASHPEAGLPWVIAAVTQTWTLALG